MRLRVWRKPQLLAVLTTFVTSLACDPSLPQPSESRAETPNQLPLHIRKTLDSQLASEAKDKKIGAGDFNRFPLPVCDGGACGAVNRDGTFAVPLAYNRVEPFREGRALVHVRHRYSYLYGYVDDAGREIAKPQFTVADRFSRGFAQIDVEGRSGLIDREGQIVLWPNFGFAVPFTQDKFWVTEERNVRQGNTGTERFEFDWPVIMVNRVSDTAVRPKGKWGLVDRSGAWIRRPEFLDIRVFDYNRSELMWARTEAGWGLIRPDLSWQIEPKYQQGGAVDDGMATVQLDGRWGFIDESGLTVIEPQFDYAMNFVGAYAPARIDKKFGMIDRKGTWIVEPRYDMIFPGGITTPKSWWVVKLGEKYGFMDDKLHMVLSPQLDQSPTMCEDGRISGIVDKIWKMFSREGAFETDHISCQGPVVYRR